MDLSNITAVGTRALHRGLLLGKKYSPQILTTVGVVSSIGSTVLASKATLKLEPVFEKFEMDREIARENRKDAAQGKEGFEEYHQQHYVREITRAYALFSLELAKLYGPSALVAGISIGCLVGSHNVLQNRNAGLAAAYLALDKSYSAFRGRVEAEFGEERTRELQYDLVSEQVHDTKAGTVQNVLRVDDPTELSGYAKWFDEMNPNWQNTSQYNVMFLQQQQQIANDRLRAHGYLFLNDVYQALGLPRTPAGAVTGWVYGPKSKGDGYVDFGLWKDNDEQRDFINGFEKSILLDFNVDGIMYDMI